MSAVFIYIPQEEQRLEYIHTFKGKVLPAEYRPQTYVVGKKEFVAFAKLISGKRLYFTDLKQHVDTNKLATELGVNTRDIQNVWAREEADSFPIHPTARMSPSYSQGWAKLAPHIDHSIVNGSIIVQLTKSAFTKNPELKPTTPTEMTEW